MALATTVSGWRSITSSAKALNAFPTSSLWHCTSRTERKTSRLVAASISLRCGIRCGWQRTSLLLTSSPAAASSLKIVEHSESDRPATIITLGDYVDRGPKSRQVIERLMDWGSPDLKLVCLKGNHEDIMWQCCRQPIKAGWWMDNGGGATLISYGQNYGDIVNVKVVPEQHLRWIEALPLM